MRLTAGLAAAAGGALAGLAARSAYERSHFVTERFVITSEKLRGGEKNLVFLSDLHSNEFGEGNARLLEELMRLSPDGILIGGDMMVCHGKPDLERVYRLTERLVRIAPVFYANGNHEARMDREREIYGDGFDVFTKTLGRQGVIYLSDASADLGSDIRITGCNLEEIYYRHRFTVPTLPGEELERHAGRADSRRFQILMLHSPLFFDACRAWGADLTLSGHFHGGTIRIPGLGGVMTPQYQFFLPWCAGRFEAEGKTMLVSRGLGTHSINIRLNNRPQLMWVTLRGQERKANDGNFL